MGLFGVLTLADMAMRVVMERHMGGFPVVDHWIWKRLQRCLQPLERDDERHDQARATWLQAQNMIELMSVFASAYREWAYHSSRYIFVTAYTPKRDSSFDMDALVFKTVVLVFV